MKDPHLVFFLKDNVPKYSEGIEINEKEKWETEIQKQSTRRSVGSVINLWKKYLKITCGICNKQFLIGFGNILPIWGKLLSSYS